MAIPNSSIQLSCTWGTSFWQNEMYFTLTPPAGSTEIDFHNAKNDRFDIYIKQGNLHHFWIDWKYDINWRWYVTIDSIENNYNFWASTLTCIDKTYTGSVIWNIGSNRISINTNYQPMQDFIFYIIVLPLFFIVLVWFITRRLLKLFF